MAKCALETYFKMIYLHFNRLQLTGFHYNENSDRELATNKKGEKRYDIRFPKYRKGEYVVKGIKTDATFSEYSQSS